MTSADTRLRVRWLGRLPYLEAWDLQRSIWEGKADGRTADDYLLLLEHPEVYTIGRNGDGSNLLIDQAELTEWVRRVGHRTTPARDTRAIDEDYLGISTTSPVAAKFSAM